MLVFTTPGQSTETPMLWGTKSVRIASDMPTTANLVALYTPKPPKAKWPAIDAVLTKWPPSPCALMRSMNVWVPLMTPFKFTLTTQSQSG